MRILRTLRRLSAIFQVEQNILCYFLNKTVRPENAAMTKKIAIKPIMPQAAFMSLRAILSPLIVRRFGAKEMLV